MKKFLFFALLCATIPFTACEDDKVGDTGKPDPVIAVKSVALDKPSVTVVERSTVTLVATVAPENATKKTVTWISEDPTVATVTSDGVVTGVKAGTTNIVINSDYDKTITAKCAVTVDKLIIPVTGVTLNKPTTTIEIGKTETLTATIAPADATEKTVEWTSSAPTIASVSATGVVTAKAVGSATITVKTKDGAKTATCAVTVKDVPATVAPEKTTVTLANAGGPLTVNVTANKGFTATSNQTWLTVAEAATSVTLTPGGNLGKADRTATVTLTSKADANVKATITVNQKKAVYADYTGNWTLTGVDAGTQFTYSLAIAQATAGSTYKVTGWGKSIVATDSKYALVANYDAETGLIYIAAQENIGVYGADGIQYNVMFYGNIMRDKLYYVGGYGYICYLGAILSDGKVQWLDGEVEVTTGSPEAVVGARYYIVNPATPDKASSFQIDTPFMKKPVMTKATGGSAPAYSPVWRGAAAYETSFEAAAIKIAR